MKLFYYQVFDRYVTSCSDKLAELSFSLYRYLRLRFEKIFPVPEYEKHYFYTDPFSAEEASKIPEGYDYIKHQAVDGSVALDYIDLYDYLPKEDLSKFIISIKKCVHRNRMSPGGSFCSREDLDRLAHLGTYCDGEAFSHILSIQLRKNKKLKNSCSNITISLRNVSATFLLVKYRIHVTETFNKTFSELCRENYSGYNTVYRRFNSPWYAPRSFGRSSHTGNNVRQEKRYQLISKLKWQILKELTKNFHVYFWKDGIFMPSFETYSTNIRPSKDRSNLEFWDSISFGHCTDYAPEYNACVCWDYENSKHEGSCLTAYCGGGYGGGDFLPEIARYDISDIYSVYLTASALGVLAEQNITKCSKRISKVIKNAKTSKALKLRVNLEQKIYYSYRFISEFSGNSIDYSDAKAFKHEFFKKGSMSSRNLQGISERIKDEKKQIDTILELLNNSVEYNSSRSNMKIQLGMMLITFLSLIIALLSVNNPLVLKVCTTLLTWIKCVLRFSATLFGIHI